MSWKYHRQPTLKSVECHSADCIITFQISTCMVSINYSLCFKFLFQNSNFNKEITLVIIVMREGAAELKDAAVVCDLSSEKHLMLWMSVCNVIHC